MRNVYLYGALADQCGQSHRFAIESIPEAMQALCANFPSLVRTMRDGFYRVIVGKTRETGVEMGEREVVELKLGTQDLHIVPVTEGRGSGGGLGKILAGLLLIGLAFIPGGAALAATSLGFGGATIGSVATSLGTGLLLTGVAALIAPEKGDEDENKSYTMTGPQSNMREGGIVPIVYGEVYTGGTLIAANLNIETTALSGQIGVGENPPSEDDEENDWFGN